MNIGGFDVMAVLPLLIMFAIFYFLLIRPQQQKLKAHQQMLEAIRRGDKIVTNGGIIGTVVKVTNERELLVEIADGIKVRIVRSMISDVPAKLEAANTDGADTVKRTTKE